MTALYHSSQPPSTIPDASGIYCIRCTANNKFYVGSAICLRRRWIEHRSKLRRNIHCNPKMQASWNKHTEDAFVYEIIEIVLMPELLTAREQHFIDTLKPVFNIAPVAGSSLGRKHTPEELEKMRATSLGRKMSPETIANMCKAQSNHAVSQAAREKSRATQIGRPSTRIGWKPTPEQLARQKVACIPQMRTIIAIAPDGTEYLVTGVKAFCTEHNLNCTLLIRAAKGIVKQHKGWTARYPD